VAYLRTRSLHDSLPISFYTTTALLCRRLAATCSSHPQAEFLEIVGHVVLECVASMVVFLDNPRIIPLQGVRVPLIALMLLVEDFVLRFAQHEKATLSQ